MDNIDGVMGEDVIRSRGGNDLISGGDDGDRFVYSGPSHSPLPAYGDYTEGVDLILAFRIFGK